MAHHYQKKWVFTWNTHEDYLPDENTLCKFMSTHMAECVFQLEKAPKTGRLHYQGRFLLKGPRQGKKSLLNLFQTEFEIRGLTLDHEIVYDSTKYCTKSETRVSGPWYAGLKSYISQNQQMTLKLKQWQDELLALLAKKGKEIKDRGVIWVQDSSGAAGKSTFIRYLVSNKEFKVAKLPIDSTDRLRSAIINISKKQDVDIFVFDFTRTRGKDSHIENLFEVIEEIKNGLVVDVMYGNYRKAFLDYPHVIIFTNEDIKNY